MHFKITDIREDFIVGYSKESLQADRGRIERELSEAGAVLYERGVLITEREPARFTLTFLLCLEKAIPIILGNPDWSLVEWASFKQQFNPALVFGDHFDGMCSDVGYFTNTDRGVVLIPTGGTSSQQLKFTRHQWGNLVSQARMVHHYLNQAPINSVCCLPLYHVSGLMQLIRALVTEGQICFTDLRSLAQLPSEINLNDFCISLVPAQLQRLFTADPSFACLLGYKRIFVGGAPARVEIVDKAIEKGLPIVLCYGMTETAGMVLVQEAFLKSQTGYKALFKVSVALEKAEGLQRIRLFSPSLFEGYSGSEKINSKLGFLTQDLGYFDLEGCLQITGRSDSVVISGGEKIVPQEVESVIRKSPHVEDVLVVGEPCEHWGQSLTAIIQISSKHASQLDTNALRSFLKGQIANYKIPKRYILVDALPIHENGKINRAHLEALLNP
jgi:O-succinylbenzoic acid--CoA ligase